MRQCASAVRAVLVALLVPIFVPSFVYAQVQAQAVPAAAPAKPEPASKVNYEDRVLTIEVQPEPTAAELQREQENLLGLPRSMRFDYQLNTTSANNLTSRSSGLSTAVAMDTQHYGALALTVNLSDSTAAGDNTSSNNQRRALWRFDQRAMPFNYGWLGNHAVGTIDSAVTPLARGFSRLTLPSVPIEGANAQYQRLGTALNASFGRVGLFSGRNLDGFSASGGKLFSFGGQARVNPVNAVNSPQSAEPRIDIAAQFMQSLGVSQGASADSSNINSQQNSSSVYLTGAWQGRAPWATPEGFSKYNSGSKVLVDSVYGLQTQVGMVLSRIQPTANSIVAASSALGVWQDLSWRTPAWRQAASLYYFQPNLTWGNSALPGDLQGLMYRADTATRQWSFGFSSELSSRIQVINNANRDASLFATTNAGYQLSNTASINAALTVRTGDSKANAIQLSFNQTNRFGNTQWRSSWLRSPKSDMVRIGFDQAWKIGTQDALSTALSYEIDRNNARRDGSWIWNVVGSLPVPFTESASISGVVGGTQSSRRNRSEAAAKLGLNASVTSEDTFTANTRNIAVQFATPLSRSWSFSAHYTLSRGRIKRDTSLLSPFEIAALPIIANLTEAGSVLFLISYSASAGRNQIPLGRKSGLNGGANSVGAGRLEGTVFFDNNGDGTRQADEAGVANVTLLLNGRYLARTNGQGRYTFDFVATGEQQLEVVPDNVPLPWSPKDRDAIKVTVLVRETTTTNFALQR